LDTGKQQVILDRLNQLNTEKQQKVAELDRQLNNKRSNYTPNNWGGTNQGEQVKRQKTQA